MRVRMVLPLVLICLVFIAGCGSAGRGDGADRDGAGTETMGGTSAHTTAGETTAAETSTEATVGAEKEEPGSTTATDQTGTGGKAESSGEGPFIASPESSGGEGFQADSILAVRYGDHGGYERVVLDLGTGSRPAGSIPEWKLTSPTGDGLLRVSLPSVSATQVSDGKLGGKLLKDFHAVRGPDGGMFVDIVADEAFTYRVMELTDPARLVVDFKPSEMPLDMPLPAEGDKTVVTQPREGERVGSSLTVSGYSRNFEGTNTIVLTDSGGEVIARKTVQANDWAVTWGYFETTLKAPSFSGRGTLRVGAESARDGTFEGVEVPVRGSG
ncbi:MAG TPA: Gmad2 immunoglobulin-like domain-containing protein [Rubrobacteraceae bacterium]|nr:Gmad2 immunoglobulin-like domain-containing protein [Rubrobacteraceae bacterium]